VGELTIGESVGITVGVGSADEVGEAVAVEEGEGNREGVTPVVSNSMTTACEENSKVNQT